jgi:hypothetical protein
MAMGGGCGEYSPCYGGISVTRGDSPITPECPALHRAGPRRAGVQLKVSAQVERQQTSRCPDAREHR